MNWRKKIETNLVAIMPYCFTDSTGKRPKLNEEEFYGPEGQLAYLQEIVEECMKQAFFLGFASIPQYREENFTNYKGEPRTKESLKFVFDTQVGTLWRERAWLEGRKILED